MIEMDYSDWCYEYERCYDIFEECGIHFYGIVMQMLEEMYPHFYDIWLDDAIEFDSEGEGVVDEIGTK